VGSSNEEEDKINISLVVKKLRSKMIGGHEVSFLKENVLPSYSQGEIVVDGNGNKNFKKTNYKRNRL
jgi:hypothetical protein